MPTKNKEPITYQQFMSDKEEAMDNTLNSVAAEYNFTLTKVPAARGGLELKFEWEE
ncbi:hypothetical protein [Flavobacterium cyanobacteriorum]|uniref:hypothetical protein n=1 Tax=Flavobacterium cyanobacteriorum TaxID=2022802 RepID=UPI0013FD73B6|nr:hypothetical protein [Flavobacterium cyanobacteriorum]